MAKRFTDTDKWKKQLLKSMPAKYKLLWLYICDDCDHAGIWHVDMQIASLRIGEDVELEKAVQIFGDKIKVFDDGEKWFIPGFIEFQYGILNEKNRVHESILKILYKYNLIENKGLTSTLQGAMDKDMDKDKEKDKESAGEIFLHQPKNENEIQYTIEHCLTVALNDNRWVQANKATRNDLEAFNKKLEGRGIYQKNPADYKTHFHNWKAGGMKDKDIPEVSKVIANRDQKAKNFLNSIN